MGIAPDSILGEAVSTVTEQMAQLDVLSTKYGEELSAALAQIGAVKVAEIPPPSRLDAPPPPDVPVIDLSGMPSYTPESLDIPSPPANFDIDLGSLDLGDLSLPDAPEPILIVIPEAPSMSPIAVPVRPDIDTSIDLPAAPDISMPEMEALEQLNLPVFVFPELPIFDAVPPSASNITVPSVFINWVEPSYASELLDDIKQQVSSMMEGGTGLPPAIQDALFSRTRERDSVETNRAVQEAVDTWASRNFSMPPGMLVKQADAIREDGRLKAAETNRDIMIEAGKWEIENLRFAVQQGIALEQLTTNMHENFAKRLFEVAKYQAEAQISVFNSQIALFNAQNTSFESLAQVYKTKIEAAVSKLTAYKTAIDGQVALGQINQQKVEVYKARIGAVESAVEVYKATMQGAQVRAETIKNQFDAFRADVQAYAEQVGAEKVKFDAYESQVKAEGTKAQVFDTQSRAYAATIQGLSSQADIKLKSAELRMEAARTKVSKFLADVDAYKAQLETGLRRVQYGTSVYQAQVEGWKAGTSAAIADAEMHSRYADMNARTNIAYSEMQISEYTSKLQNAIQQANIALEASKAVGQYTAQLASGALSAAHVSASISGSGSASTSDSTSNSTSQNYNY